MHYESNRNKAIRYSVRLCAVPFAEASREHLPPAAVWAVAEANCARVFEGVRWLDQRFSLATLEKDRFSARSA